VASEIDIPGAVRQHLLNQYQQWPVQSNRSSTLGFPCLRHLVYKRTRWREEAAPPADLLAIFAEGNLHEEAVITAMRNAGIKVILQQRAFEYKEHEITGSIDGQIVVDGASWPFDIKSTSSYTFRSLNTVEDVIAHKYHYVRSWRSQLVLYCLLAEKERSYLILKDKQTGALKQIEVPLDYAHAEELIQKADAINAHVKAGTLPDRIPYDADICGRCSFFGICLPDEALRAGAELVDDPEFAAKLGRRADLEGAAREFSRLDEEIKAEVKRRLTPGKEAVIGVDWLVRLTSSSRKAYQVPETDVVTVRIERLGPKHEHSTDTNA